MMLLQGTLQECGCGPTPTSTNKNFLWSGCSDNIKFGNAFSRKLMDTEDKNKADAR